MQEPSAIIRGTVGKAVQAATKRANDPDVIVKKLFSKADRIKSGGDTISSLFPATLSAQATGRLLGDREEN